MGTQNVQLTNSPYNPAHSLFTYLTTCNWCDCLIYELNFRWLESAIRNHRCVKVPHRFSYLLPYSKWHPIPGKFFSFNQYFRGNFIEFRVLIWLKVRISLAHFYAFYFDFLKWVWQEQFLGTDLPTVYRSGWLVVGLSALLSVLVILNAKRNKGQRKLQKNA
jgi:hypothetical protein